MGSPYLYPAARLIPRAMGRNVVLLSVKVIVDVMARKHQTSTGLSSLACGLALIAASPTRATFWLYRAGPFLGFLLPSGPDLGTSVITESPTTVLFLIFCDISVSFS